MNGRLAAAITLVVAFVAFPQLPHDLFHHHSYTARLGWFALEPAGADGCQPFLVWLEETGVHGGLLLEREARSVVERKCPDAAGAFRFDSAGYWDPGPPEGGP